MQVDLSMKRPAACRPQPATRPRPTRSAHRRARRRSRSPCSPASEPPTASVRLRGVHDDAGRLIGAQRLIGDRRRGVGAQLEHAPRDVDRLGHVALVVFTWLTDVDDQPKFAVVVCSGGLGGRDLARPWRHRPICPSSNAPRWVVLTTRTWRGSRAHRPDRARMRTPRPPFARRRRSCRRCWTGGGQLS